MSIYNFYNIAANLLRQALGPGVGMTELPEFPVSPCVYLRPSTSSYLGSVSCRKPPL